MKNIETILTEAGIEITDEQKEAVNKGIAENYKTVNEFTAKVTKLEGERDTYKTQYNDVKTSLGKFDGVDVDALKKQIEDANKKAEEAEKTAAAKLAQRDYDDAVKASTAGTKFSSSAARRDFTALLDEAYRAASVTGDLTTNDATILAFGQLGGQLMKNAVAPEADAFTFATLAGLDNILTTDGADLTTGETILEAIRAAENAMDAEEVDTGRILYIAPALYRAVQAMDSYKSQQVLADFSKIQLVPVKRFYTAIDMQDGKTSGEEAGGYKKAEEKQTEAKKRSAKATK